MRAVRVVPTYHCNIMCNNCLYGCAPFKKGSMKIKDFQKEIREYNTGNQSEYIIIDGGDPFLDTGRLSKYLKSISMLEAKKLAVTNGHWGDSDMYLDILLDLGRTGLNGIIFEYDFSHSVFIKMDLIKSAISMCVRSGLDIFIRACFFSGDISRPEDILTFEYIKELRKTFNNAQLIFERVRLDNLKEKQRVEQKIIKYKK